MKLAAVVAVAVVVWSGASAAQERPRDGVTLPQVVKEVKPHYPREVMGEGVQGSVVLNVVDRSDERAWWGGRFGSNNAAGSLRTVCRIQRGLPRGLGVAGVRRRGLVRL